MQKLLDNIASTEAVVITATRADVFPKLEAELAKRGKSWKNVVRTWFYLKDIGTCYDAFNAIRTSYFAAQGVDPYPASTGIGLRGDVPEVTAALLLTDAPWRPVASPLQVAAAEYGSHFSRAAETNGRLYISGTAALKGHDVAFVGDFARQMDFALEAVHAILVSKGRDWADVTRLIAYCRDEENIPRAEKRIGELGMATRLKPHLLVMRADVCRPDWLFELELDAALC